MGRWPWGQATLRGPNERLDKDRVSSWRGDSWLSLVHLDGRARRRWGAPGLREARHLGLFLEHPDVTLAAKEDQEPQPQQGNQTQTRPRRGAEQEGGAGGREECATSTASPSRQLLDWRTAQLLAWVDMSHTKLPPPLDGQAESCHCHWILAGIIAYGRLYTPAARSDVLDLKA
jgi:hypothetical protein